MLSKPSPKSTAKVLDFIERVGSTFAAAFIAVGLATGLNDTKSIEAASIAGAVSAGKFLLIELNKYNQEHGA